MCKKINRTCVIEGLLHCDWRGEFAVPCLSSTTWARREALGLQHQSWLKPPTLRQQGPQVVGKDGVGLDDWSRKEDHLMGYKGLLRIRNRIKGRTENKQCSLAIKRSHWALTGLYASEAEGADSRASCCQCHGKIPHNCGAGIRRNRLVPRTW